MFWLRGWGGVGGEWVGGLGPKNGKSGRGGSRQFAQQLESAVTAPPLVGCVVWRLPTIITANFNTTHYVPLCSLNNTFISISQINFCVTHYVSLCNLLCLQLSKYRNSWTCKTIHPKIQSRV